MQRLWHDNVKSPAKALKSAADTPTVPARRNLTRPGRSAAQRTNLQKRRIYVPELKQNRYCRCFRKRSQNHQEERCFRCAQKSGGDLKFEVIIAIWQPRQNEKTDCYRSPSRGTRGSFSCRTSFTPSQHTEKSIKTPKMATGEPKRC